MHPRGRLVFTSTFYEPRKAGTGPDSLVHSAPLYVHVSTSRCVYMCVRVFVRITARHGFLFYFVAALVLTKLELTKKLGFVSIHFLYVSRRIELET